MEESERFHSQKCLRLTAGSGHISIANKIPKLNARAPFVELVSSPFLFGSDPEPIDGRTADFSTEIIKLIGVQGRLGRA